MDLYNFSLSYINIIYKITYYIHNSLIFYKYEIDEFIYNIEIHYNIPNTKYSITIIIPITRTIDPIMYNSLAGREGTNLFKTNKIIPIIINAIPVSNDTISILL